VGKVPIIIFSQQYYKKQFVDIDSINLFPKHMGKIRAEEALMEYGGFSTNFTLIPLQFVDEI